MKICPLMSINSNFSEVKCQKEKCMWWVDKIEDTSNHIKRGCAIKLLAEAQPHE